MDMSIRFPNLGIDLEYVAKSIHIFGFEITIYGILIAVGMLLGISFVVLEAKRHNYNQDMYLDMMIVSLIAGVIGARLLYVICSWDLYRDKFFDIFNTRNGGLALYGGILGGVIASAVFCRIKKLQWSEMADYATMGLLIGQIVGRWGDFFNRESFGEYTEKITAMQLPLSSVHVGEVTSAMRENLLTIDGVSYIQAHPVFFYESLWCLLLFGYLLIKRRKKCFDGEIFMRYLAGYGFGRFFLELLRTDKLYIPGTKIGINLVISGFLFLFFSVVILVKGTMVRKREKIWKNRRKEYDSRQERELEPEEKELEFEIKEPELEAEESESEIQEPKPEEKELEAEEKNQETEKNE